MDYEKELEEYRAGNQKYIDLFRQWLEKEEETRDIFQADERPDDMDLFLNYYLPSEDFYSVEAGCRAFPFFFGYFLQRKVMGIGVSDAYRMSTSLKMFYRLMVDEGIVKESDYKEMLEDIDENLDHWLHDIECSIYPEFFENEQDDDELERGQPNI